MSKKIALSTNTSKPSPTSSAAAAAAAEIIASNVDLLTEILVWVPAKSLIKFKSVSKQWLSLISNPQFCRNHTTHQNHPPMPSGLYFYSTKDCFLSLNERIIRVSVNGHPRMSLPNFSFLDGAGAGAGSGFETKLLHSSNGLMLCSVGETSRSIKHFVVFNLTTQKFVVLPTLGVLSQSSGRYKSYLVFDPKKSPYYKVAVYFVFHMNTLQLAVYSSESGSWKTAILNPRIPIPSLGLGAVWNGAIILMNCRGGWQCYANHDHCFFRWDIDAEKLNTVTRLPPLDTDLSKEIIIYLGECGGRLLLIQIASYNATEFRVLEMMDRENNFRWTVKYVGDLTHITRPKVENFMFVREMTVMKVGANENDLALVFYKWGKVVQYNIECKTTKALCDLSRGNFLTNSFIDNPCINSHHFIESLMPI